MPNKTAEKIYDVISTNRFAQFYGKVEESDNCPFTLHLEGGDDCLTKEQVLERITQLFNLNDNG